MSLIQPAFYEFLSGITELTAEIQDKIYPAGAVPTGTKLPYLTSSKVDNLHTNHQGGSSGLAEPRIQVDVWGEIEEDANRIFDIVRRNLDGFRGVMGTDPDDAEVKVAFLENDREEYNPPDDATQQGGYRSSGDFMIWFVEGG